MAVLWRVLALVEEPSPESVAVAGGAIVLGMGGLLVV